MRTRWLLLIAGVLAGCGPAARGASGAADVTLAVEPARVRAGEPVTLVLRNQSSDTLGYNLCSSALEREANGQWQPVPSDRMCTMELRMLTPGESARYPVALEASVGAGRYRFVTSVERMGSGTRESVTSAPFAVGS